MLPYCTLAPGITKYKAHDKSVVARGQGVNAHTGGDPTSFLQMTHEHTLGSLGCYSRHAQCKLHGLEPPPERNTSVSLRLTLNVPLASRNPGFSQLGSPHYVRSWVDRCKRTFWGYVCGTWVHGPVCSNLCKRTCAKRPVLHGPV